MGRGSCCLAATGLLLAAASSSGVGAFMLPSSSSSPVLVAARSRVRAAGALRMSEVVVPGTGDVKAAVKKYCESVYQTKRRPTRTVWAGKVPIGSEHPIACQTMGTTDTRDVMATVEQAMRVADYGGDLFRITVQGKKEAEACHGIREELFKRGYDIPLVADIHFQPKVALLTAEACEKIRVNPGNFADGAKKFTVINYENEEDFKREVDYIEEVFTPLVQKCKSLGRAMRIGTNHGSLSARILSFYGDTPRGMVESAFEFAQVCRKHDYHNFLFSMKASNPLVMVQAYRLLAAEMYKKGWDYPLHLGVTEAGEGEDGRMKSAIGIGSLLMDGLGDTIRVSLTEDPEFELAPCRYLAEEIGRRATQETAKAQAVPAWTETKRDFENFAKRKGDLPLQQEGEAIDFRSVLHRDGSVISAVTLEQLSQPDQLYYDLGCKTAVGMPFKDIATSDSVFLRQAPPAEAKDARTALRRLQESGVGVLIPASELKAQPPVPNAIAVFTLGEVPAGGEPALPEGAARYAVTLDGSESDAELQKLKALKPIMVLINVDATKLSRVHASRRLMEFIVASGLTVPVIHHFVSPAVEKDQLILRCGTEVGCMLVDGLGDGLMLEGPFDLSFLRTTSFATLQGSRMRNTKTEFVSCPSCGRTLFDLQETTANIQKKTGHLPGVAIAVMGCIVNGPGEMADADFGYVGGAPGKVDLYVGKEMVKKGIPNEEATDALVELIKEHGRWVEPSESAEAPAKEKAVA